MSARKRRTRRLRRKAKAIVKHGPGAGPRHKSRSGRTGKIRSTKIKGSIPARALKSARAEVGTVAAHREGRPKGGTFATLGEIDAATREGRR